MPACTQVDLNDVENLAPKFGLDPGLEPRLAANALGLEQLG